MNKIKIFTLTILSSFLVFFISGCTLHQKMGFMDGKRIESSNKLRNWANSVEKEEPKAEVTKTANGIVIYEDNSVYKSPTYTGGQMGGKPVSKVKFGPDKVKFGPNDN
ncbi:MAG: hypothetical protein PHV68_00015 [Candidatus Gastranaerophilales bacterium]|nr:hypothetical protein [Candidatus Gastranaerophilales bacterium]